jgi:feruloyl esterase
MRWPKTLQTLRRGLRLAARVAKAELPLLRPAPDVLPAVPGRLVEFSGFGPNPGQLRMLAHVPTNSVAATRALIVLLHGCGQGAEGFAAASGWIALSDRLGIPLVLPEQADSNNAGRCFQWFQPTETARDQGEAASIAAMTRAAITRFDSDPARVFIAGLSAGGAMTAALLAAYPDLFAAGAVVAGLPVGSAGSPMQGLLRMASAGPKRSPAAWAEEVRRSGPRDYRGHWPRLSIWHGDADDTVAPGNALLLATQWRTLHDLPEVPAQDSTVDGVRHRVWGEAVELWTLPGMPHGYPVGAGVGQAAPFMLDRGLPATPRIAAFWGLE